MIFSRAWFALMRRNLVYRRRHWLSSILELTLPIIFVGILVAIKNAVERGSSLEPETIEPYFPGNFDAFTPLSFYDYVTAMQSKRVCERVQYELNGVEYDFYQMSGMPFEGFNWQVPMVKCDPRDCTEEDLGKDSSHLCEFSILALSGTDEGGMERANEMKDYILEHYPLLTDKEAINASFDLVQVFDDSAYFDEYVKSGTYGTLDMPKIAMGIVFTGNDPKNYQYELRQNSTNFNNPTEEGRPAVITTPSTGSTFESFSKSDTESCIPLDGGAFQGPLGLSCTGQYVYNGVLTFQRLVGDFILNQTGAADLGFKVASSGVSFVPFPTREYVLEGFYGAIAGFAPFLIMLGLLYPVSCMISYIVKEKELRQKELMKMMSVTESDIGQSWFVTFFLFNIVTGTLTAMVSNVLYVNSQNGLMWLFWVYLFMAMIVFCMAIASFNSKSTRAVVIGVLMTFAGYILGTAIDYRSSDAGLIGLVSLHPITAFTYGMQEIGRLEDAGIGITQSSIASSEFKSGYSFSQALNSLAFDCFFWGIFSWYFNRVIKPDYGQALPWNFPFMLSYWFSGSSNPPEDSQEEVSHNNASVPLEPVGEALERQSDEGQNIVITDLVKRFGEKSAVDGLNLTMYSGQITALLGHNGAGKTTTIGMLTGALSPTSGHAVVAGKDIRTQMSEIRQDIGICLQHDCLFPQLTVREHVQFFSRLKGLYAENTKAEAEEQVDQAIRDVALFDKRNTMSRNLSGGMKRKLSVAMAFCGGSKVVLLDEPTSGMDPFSRRFTWNVIRQYRRDRCIILTTHFMDEADILGDRIAIMAEGQLRCAGSSLFLKKQFGVGYQLTIEKVKSQLSPDDPLASGTDDGKLMEIVQSNVKEASMLSNVGSEMSYQLPMGEAGNFGPMFEALDQEVDDGRVSSYGVGITTLDEVFLLVARGGQPEDKEEFASSKRLGDAGDITLNDENSKSATSRMDLENEGMELAVRHVGALFKKRAAFFRRDKKAWCCTTLLPSIFVFLGFIAFKFAGPNRNLGSLELTLDDYNPGVTANRNPIVYNSPSEPFTCQPGDCSYTEDTVFEDVDIFLGLRSETFLYCGAQARLDTDQCSVSVSSAAERLTDYGGAPIATDVNDVFDGSFSLFETSDVYEASQYGAIYFTRDDSSLLSNSKSFSDVSYSTCLENADLGDFSSAADCEKFLGVGYVIQYNFTALHVAPLFQAMADEALVREALDDDEFKIGCTLSPLPITKTEESLGQAEDAFLAWVLVILSFPFIAGAFASFIVVERESKAKHLQTVAGVDPWAYWISTFLWDVLNYQLPLWITVLLMFVFDVSVMTTSSGNVFSGILAILIFFGPATAGYAYCMSFAFKSPSLANIVLIISGFLIGFGGPLAVIILVSLGQDDNQNLLDIANIVTWCMRWNPCFCLGKGLLNAINIEAFRFWEEDPNISVFHPSILGLEVVFLALQSVFFIALAVALDVLSTNPSVMSVFNSVMGVIFCKCDSSVNDDAAAALPDDSDVIEEQERVSRGDANDDLIVIDKLTKVYDTGKRAVDGISLGIPAGQCFGLLGINGAGKTTTMGMLTAEFPPSTGDATLAGYSVSREPEKTRRRIGYCPQFDAHFANLTGREHVELYASIKGVPREAVKDAAAAKLREVGLSEFDSDRLSVGYSGGMKRRLSLACATIGQPQIVFLDECSTGVDPVARREIWQLVSDMVAGSNVAPEERTSVILTTHSMEECEALCPRIGIMANGRMRCLGSAQHLKNKFGQGFQVELKVKGTDKEDEDYVNIATALAQSKGMTFEDMDDVSFSLAETIAALQALTNDDSLAVLISPMNTIGFSVYKDATAETGIPLEGLAGFATIELRMRKLQEFMMAHYPNNQMRERQDTKARYEVNSQGVRIAGLFASIESNKEDLRLADYGVSQTSLEQVFNMHAEEAERLKQGRNDH